MKCQQGMATLLLTSVLLLVALIFSLASYKNLFYQIKRSQNEILARQAHWQAEGGVECLWTILNKTKEMIDVDNFISMSICDKNNNKVFIKNKEDKKIVSKYDDLVISKDFESSHHSMASLITSTSDLVISGDMDIYPQPGVKTETGYNCKIAEFSGGFEIKGKIRNKGFHPSFPPYDDFVIEEPSPPPIDWNEPNIYVQKCNYLEEENFFTREVENKKYTDTSLHFKQDYKKLETLDPFKNIFGYPDYQWELAKKELFFQDVDGGMNCAENIKEMIKSTDENQGNLFWITGNCDLTEGISSLELESKNNSFILVVQDGLVGLHGSAILNALIYQFRSPNNNWTPTKSSWEEMNKTIYGSIPFKEGSQTRDYDSYINYQSGSFITSGGVIFDVPGYKATITGSGNFSYNGDVIKDNLSLKPRWKEGSWRDF